MEAAVETVTIPRAEYDRLREAAEMLADVAAFDRAMAERADGLPHEYMRRIVAGEAPLRVWRTWRGLTQAALSERSGVNRVQIADIEAGRKTGSVATTRALADALGATMDDLA
jgi:DNA-binding XRE family transcriptional regulator